MQLNHSRLSRTKLTPIIILVDGLQPANIVMSVRHKMHVNQVLVVRLGTALHKQNTEPIEKERRRDKGDINNIDIDTGR